VNSSGGIATRLTSAPGNESSPRFSPDGKTIAFTGEYDGSQNVYTIPVEGGEPFRVTYNPGGAQSMGWTPDGQRIVFRSYFETYITRTTNLYFVDKNGSALERFPIDRGTMCSFSADGKKMVYVRKGNEEYNWKRYKGGEHTDIWLYDFETKNFTLLTDYVGKNAYPMWIGNAMYYVSDQSNGIANIYAMDLSTKAITQVTQFSDVDVIRPETDGKSIVFMHDGYINVLDVNSKQVKKIDVLIPTDRWALRSKVINPKDYIQSVSISNDGSAALLEARGDVLKVATEDGKSLNLSNTPGTRERFPQLSPDGKTVAFFSDKSGEYQLYTQSAEGGEWNQLTTSLDRTVYRLAWSPDGKKILFGNKDFSIFYIDVATKKLVKIDESHQMKNDEFYWEICDYNWSPDSKWITYSFVQRNRNSQIFIYSLEQEQKYPVTTDFYDNLYPTFDANGKYLYFVSSRNFDIQMDFYEDNHIYSNPQQIMCITLRNNEKPPFADAVSKEPANTDEFRIDVEGIQNRAYPLPVEAGNYFYLKAGKNKVAWCSVDKFTEDEYEEIFLPKGATKWNLHIFDMNDKKDVVLNEKIRDFKTSLNQLELIIRKDNDVFTTAFDQAYKAKTIGAKLNLGNLTYNLNYRDEWKQIFNDTWRWYRDFFYDPGMHGRDWKALGEKYGAYVNDISSREDLNWVLLQMVGDLCVSHTYISGGDQSPVQPTNSPIFAGWLGADLVKDVKAGYYRFEKIYGPTEYDRETTAPLSRPDIKLHEGDYLIAINGTEIKVPDDYFKYLQVTPGQKVTVTVNSNPSLKGALTYEIEPIRNSSKLRYNRWIADNIAKVDKLSGGKLGYMHITAMGGEGIGQFDKFWRAFRYKDGIVIDVRRNSGGWTEYFMIDKLERKMTAYNVLKNMEPFRYPGSASNGNYVAISNEYNGSDGEAFMEDFRANNFGKIVGVPSWGGLVGILNTQKTLDNGSVEQSNNAFFGREGKWLIENHGAQPDVLIDNDPVSVMAGKDPQLEKAVDVLLQQIKEHPFTFPQRPDYPKK
jgi:tricorn protease